MSKRELLEISPDGVHEFLHFDADGHLTGLQTLNDVEPVLEANKIAQRQGNKGYGESREWQKIASIPLTVLMQYCQENNIPLKYAVGGKEQNEVIARILKDPDYRYLRTDI